MDFSALGKRPLLVAIAGPNGAGKTTFFHSHLEQLGLRFVNADVLAAGLDLGAYAAADLADAIRKTLVAKQESFVFETVFSDPVGEKVGFLSKAVAAGYTVVVCFIGIGSAELSDQRVAMRVSQGGHDIPTEKLRDRYPRTLVNLAAAVRKLPHVFVYDNSDLAAPFRQIAVFENGRATHAIVDPPAWLSEALP